MKTTSAKTIDLLGEICPMTWVRTKLALEAMAPGEVLEVWLDSDDSATSVPKSAAAEGHVIRSATPDSQGGVRLVIEKRRGRSHP